MTAHRVHDPENMCTANQALSCCLTCSASTALSYRRVCSRVSCVASWTDALSDVVSLWMSPVRVAQSPATSRRKPAADPASLCSCSAEEMLQCDGVLVIIATLHGRMTAMPNLDIFAIVLCLFWIQWLNPVATDTGRGTKWWELGAHGRLL